MPQDEATKAKQAATMRAVSAARREKAAARMAAATPPGQATTIQEVLDRSFDPGALTRRRVLEALVRVGGRIDDPQSGQATAKLRAEGGLYNITQQAVSNALRDMTADKQIGKEAKGKRTFAIFLLDPIPPSASTAPEPKPEKAKAKKEPKTGKSVAQNGRSAVAKNGRNGSAPAMTDAPLPRLGEGVQVFALILGDDGEVSVGVRSEEGAKWMAQVSGYVGG